MKIFTNKGYEEEKLRIMNEIHSRMDMEERIDKTRDDIWTIMDKLSDLERRVRKLEGQNTEFPNGTKVEQ